MADLETIQQKIIAFRNERDWAQFHNPKNLAEALSIEAGELSCPVRSAINIHSVNEFMAATGPFWTSNGVEDHRAVPQSHRRRTQECKRRIG